RPSPAHRSVAAPGLRLAVVACPPSSSNLALLLQFFRALQNFIDRTLHVERLLGKLVVFAFHDFLEAADGVRKLHILARPAGELLGYVKRLGKEVLDAARAANSLLIVVAQFVDSENGDDVLQILIALQNLLHTLGCVVMLLAQNAGIENTGCGRQWIDGRVNTHFGNGAR